MRCRVDIRLEEELLLGFLLLSSPGKLERKELEASEGVEGLREGRVPVSGRAALAGLIASIRPGGFV